MTANEATPEGAESSTERAYITSNIPTGGQMYAYGLDPHACRVSEASKQAVTKLFRAHPIMRELPWNSRMFVRRVTRYMVEHGMEQLIDLGSGLPTSGNTHEVAQLLEPSTRVLYVDNDPMAKAQAQDILDEHQTRNVKFITEDVCDPRAILNNEETRSIIDFDKPIGLLMCSIWHMVSEDTAQEQAGKSTHELCAEYIDAMPSGSLIAVEHFTNQDQDPVEAQAILDGGAGINFRSHEQIRAYLDGLELVPPYRKNTAHPGDIVWSNAWQSPDETKADPTGAWIMAGVGHKP